MQVFDEQRVVAISRAVEIEDAFFGTRVIEIGDLAALGIRDPQDEVRRRVLRPRHALKQEALSLGRSEQESIDIACLIQPAVEARRKRHLRGLFGGIVGFRFEQFIGGAHRERAPAAEILTGRFSRDGQKRDGHLRRQREPDRSDFGPADPRKPQIDRRSLLHRHRVGHAHAGEIAHSQTVLMVAATLVADVADFEDVLPGCGKRVDQLAIGTDARRVIGVGDLFPARIEQADQRIESRSQSLGEHLERHLLTGGHGDLVVVALQVIDVAIDRDGERHDLGFGHGRVWLHLGDAGQVIDAEEPRSGDARGRGDAEYMNARNGFGRECEPVAHLGRVRVVARKVWRQDGVDTDAGRETRRTGQCPAANLHIGRYAGLDRQGRDHRDRRHLGVGGGASPKYRRSRDSLQQRVSESHAVAPRRDNQAGKSVRQSGSNLFT